MSDTPRFRRRPAPEVQSSDVEGRTFCDTCGQEVFVPIDVTAGQHQDFVEECPICGSPMVLRADIQQDGRAHVDGQRE